MIALFFSIDLTFLLAIDWDEVGSKLAIFDSHQVNWMEMGEGMGGEIFLAH